ncbi:MAG: hypothetical protein U0871_15070 [Gemmataceae bacterium]
MLTVVKERLTRKVAVALFDRPRVVRVVEFDADYPEHRLVTYRFLRPRNAGRLLLPSLATGRR